MKRPMLTPAGRLAAMLVLAPAPLGCGGATTTKGPDTPADAPTTTTTTADDSGSDDVAIEDFTDALAGYGAWVDVAPYGKVWQPSDDSAGADFVPYGSDGHWAVNEDNEWVFQSKHDDDFGWATYHYGRWVLSDDYGWVWIPGTKWAPAWVEWRFGGGYTGWVGVAPEGVSSGQERWTIVEDKHFLDDGPARVRLDADHVTAVWDGAAPLTEVHGDAKWIAGPPADHWKGQVKTVSMKKPGKGASKSHAKASAKKGGGKTVAAKQKPKPAAAKGAAKGAAPAKAAAPAKKAAPAGKKK